MNELQDAIYGVYLNEELIKKTENLSTHFAFS